jgi:hypothetical protein
MEEKEEVREQDFSQEEKIEIIRSWFDKYKIVKIVVKRPDFVIYLED